MQMADPVPTFSYLLSTILAKHPEFAYVHFVEPREWYVGASTFSTGGLAQGVVASNDVVRGLTFSTLR